MFSSLIVSLIEPCAISCGRPIASNTCEGSNEPDVQAEPLDAHTPFWSNNINIDSPSMNLKQKFILLGRRFFLSPFNLVNGISFKILSIA